MPVDLDALLNDLRAETDDLMETLQDAGPDDYERPTPAVGWAVRDQVSHLAFFDDVAVLAASEPDRFREDAAVLMARGEDFAAAVAADYRSMGHDELSGWLIRARREFLEVFSCLEASDRMPWFGPSMSIGTCVTARLMETWAHGQDVADALGRERVPSARLRHVADLGVRTFGFSFTVRGIDPPAHPVGVDLDGPDGERWVWNEGATELVRGPALDFCLVVTQRRPVGASALELVGDTAEQWMTVAQAYAGPPGTGRTVTA